MAGYTSRFFLTLTIPSVFGFLSVLWFLKRKSPSKSVSKAVQVENQLESEEEEEFEKQFLTLDPMKLKNSEQQSCDENVSSEMQLKETTTQTSQCNANGIQQNGKAAAANNKGKKKSKSKMREKACTFPKDYILGDSSSLEDNGIELANGIEAIDLNTTNISSAKDELLNTINKTHCDMEVTNGTNSCTSQASSALANGDAEKHTVSETDTTNRSTQQLNGSGSAKEQCDTTTTTDAEVSSTQERNYVSAECESEKTDLPPTIQTDSHEPLTLPVVCTGSPGEMLESPGATYCDSVGSNDSGKGGSEIHFDSYQVRPLPLVYEFDIYQEYVGLLIGRNGRHVRYIKEETNANILIKRHPYYDRKKICAVTGTDDEIHAALKLIRKRFPIETYPTVTLSQICIIPYDIQHPDLLKLSLPEGVSFDVMLSATVTAGHFFLQQPTHPTFHSLPFLSSQMTAVYSQDINAPPLPHVDKGYVCTANLGDAWYRAEIDEVYEDSDECRVKFLDYGGYTILPRTSLKQIRYDFMCVPFQATECYLGDVTFPDGATDWSREATAAFEELAQGQILQGFIVAYADNRVPYVKLFKVTGVNMIDINEELVRRGFAKSLLPALQ